MKTLKDWNSTPVCILCGRNSGLEKHHKKFRSQGGNNRAENLALICRICHGAVHGIRINDNGASCDNCPVLEVGCYFGEKLLGREIVTAHPWKDE